jgi:tetratricopeptide (TPR) repeat protein
MSYGSHRLRILAEELLDYEPDLFVIYSGHNEFVERRFYSDYLGGTRTRDQLQNLLFHSRVYSLMARSFERMAAPSGDAADTIASSTTGELLGLDVNREVTSGIGAAETASVQHSFEENLQAIIDSARNADVPVILCTVPSNVRGWRPNESVFDTDTSLEDRTTVNRLLAQATRDLQQERGAEAVAALEEARSIAPLHADVLYQLGQTYEQLSRWEDAWSVYRQARDHDGQPARAVSVLNDTIRGLSNTNGVLLADIEQVFEDASDHRLVGYNWLEDYVHPNARGHRLIARELWRLLNERQLVGDQLPMENNPLIGEVDTVTAAGAQPLRDYTPSRLFNLAVILENQGRFAEAQKQYLDVLARQPGFALARANLARLLYKDGRFAESLMHYRQALLDKPDHVKTMIGLAETLNSLGQLDEAERVLLRATTLDPAASPAWSSLGLIYGQQGRHSHAETVLRRAVKLAPGNPVPLAHLGFTLLFQQKLTEAAASFNQALAIDPAQLRSRNGLAAVLTEQGLFDEAQKMFNENLQIDPGDRFALGGLELIARRRLEHSTATEPD